MPATYDISVVAVCPQGHEEVNLKSRFVGTGARCARCGATLTVIREGRVRARPTTWNNTHRRIP